MSAITLLLGIALVTAVVFVSFIAFLLSLIQPWGAYRLHWSFLGLAIKGAYVIFCALFLLINGYNYWKYKHHKH